MADEVVWTSGFFNERFPAPVSPLGWSLIGPLVEEIALRDPLRYLGYPDAETIPLTRLWHGHPYANVRAFQVFYKVFPDVVLPEDAYRYFPDGDVSLRERALYPRWSDTPRVIFSLLRAFFSDPFNVSPLNNCRHWARYTREHDHRIAVLRARLTSHKGSPLHCAEPREIFAALRETERVHHDLLRIHRWSLMDADLTFGLLKGLARAWIDRDHANEIVARMVAGVPNKTLEVDAALRELANLESPISASQYQVFLTLHGHRSFSLDIAVPTFAEEPEQVMELLRMTKDAGQRAKDKDLPRPLVVGHSSSFKQAIFNWVLSLAKRYVALREDQRYYWQKSLALSRRFYLLLAERLMADRIVADRHAVFYATHQELADYFDARLARGALANSIAARQAEWREYEHEFKQSPTTSYPPFLCDDVPSVRVGAGLAPTHVEWRGRAVSPGIARGAARVVQSASELWRVQPGEVLIAPATDPAWTPVFAKIAGLVVERGGVLSHCAVVAREYHIPAVAGIPNIVAEIREGDKIEIDGNSGVVSRVVGQPNDQEK